MIIGVDGNEANVAERVGVSWYVFNILNELKSKVEGLKSKDSEELKIVVFLREKPREDLPKESKNFYYEVIKGKFLWSQLFLPLSLFLRHRNLSVFLSPAHYVPRFCPCPTIVVVHDVSYFYYPHEFLPRDLYQLKNWTGYSVQNAAQVIAVSQTTKDDLVKNYNMSPKKISVVYNGFTLEKGSGIKPEGVAVSDKFFLYLGTLQPRKNIQILILGFEEFLEKNPDYMLYLAGRKGWLYESLFDLIERHHLSKHIKFLGYVSEQEKKWLLKNAVGLVAPCLYEGFGVPVLEGFASQVPVIAANSGALPEVGEDGARYFDPLSSHALMQAMEETISKEEECIKLLKKGEQLVKKYSWKKTTEELVTILKGVAHVT